ncbi:MAG: MarR family transcriptional regulator [Candidatus Marinimicrobia bacterium]|nr:MarR family transcriptional regulator [Candidatus Neomarinimicrobiota bacterium]
MIKSILNKVADNILLLSQIIQENTEPDLLKNITPDRISRTQLSILKILYISGPQSVRSLAEIFNLSSAAISQNVDRLVKLKFINRQQQPEDRRAVTISIKKTGVSLLNKYDELRYQLHIDVLADYSEEEHIEFDKLLEKYIGNLIRHSKVLDLVCLQCDGAFNDKCQIKDHNKHCYYLPR